MDEMLKQQLLVIGALLHDVGKFAQRAKAKATIGMEQEYCPQGKTHRHVLYTDYFIEHDLPLPLELEGHRSSLARLAAAHHRPNEDSLLEKCLSYADRLSSGGDRVEGESDGNYRTARMESIFSAVRILDSAMDYDAILKYPLQALDANNVNDGVPIFPVKQEEAQKYEYGSLYEDFLVALKELPLDMGVVHYTNSLATICERFMWCIPSSTYQTKADISLYDHAWTTASISQALYAHATTTQNIQLQEARFILFGGDISGIQTYIFGESGSSHKGAAKLLRARSLMVQLLTRSVWVELLSRLNLSPVARIMDAGGRFMLLLPATDKVYATLERLKKEVEEYLLESFQGALRMHFAQLEIAATDLFMQRFRERFESFNDALEQAKLQPYARYFSRGKSAVLSVDSAGYAQYGQCSACRMHPAEGITFEEEDNESLCSQCHALIKQVGRRLPHSSYIVLQRQGKGITLFGGIKAYFEQEISQKEYKQAVDILAIRDRKAFSAAPIAGYVPRITEADMERWKKEGRLHKGAEGGYVFAGEALAEHPLGESKTFSMLAEEARIADASGWRSIPCLAACKADVDNLGLIFGVGFGVGEKSLFSISRFAMLSRMLHNFFASHLMQCIEREFPHIYVIFAGGDDLFVLGPWSDILRFSLRLQEDFTAFCGGNPHITLCAGMPLIKAKLPVTDIKNVAEEALEAAKQHTGKNAAHAFNQTCSWANFSELMQKGQWLEELCLQGAVTQGFVRRILGYSRELEEFMQGDVRKGLCISHFTYDMARNCDVEKLSAKDMADLQALMHKDKRSLSACMEMSVSWALYRTRK